MHVAIRGHASLLCIVPFLTDDPRRKLLHGGCFCSWLSISKFPRLAHNAPHTSWDWDSPRERFFFFFSIYLSLSLSIYIYISLSLSIYIYIYTFLVFSYPFLRRRRPAPAEGVISELTMCCARGELIRKVRGSAKQGSLEGSGTVPLHSGAISS